VENDRSILTFFGVWMLLVVGNMIFMFTSRNAALKRVVAGILTALVSVTIGGVILLGSLQHWTALIFLPLLVLTVAFNARKIRFCDACGMTNFGLEPVQVRRVLLRLREAARPKRMWF
jgi:hypothetical protein